MLSSVVCISIWLVPKNLTYVFTNMFCPFDMNSLVIFGLLWCFVLGDLFVFFFVLLTSIEKVQQTQGWRNAYSLIWTTQEHTRKNSHTRSLDLWTIWAVNILTNQTLSFFVHLSTLFFSERWRKRVITFV